MAFTEKDYPKLTELLTLKHTVTLDCDRGGYTEDELEDGETGFIYFSFGDQDDSYGNVESDYLDSLHGYDEALQQKILSKRFRTFVQDDGEIALEISYLPGAPISGVHSQGFIEAIWAATRLREIMSYEEFIRDIDGSARWIDSCFGAGGEVYGVIVEVTKPGRTPTIEDFDVILPKPLWIQRKGQKYNVHVRYWQD